MNEHHDLFDGFAMLDPTPEQTVAAIERVRLAVVEAAEEVSSNDGRVVEAPLEDSRPGSPRYFPLIRLWGVVVVTAATVLLTLGLLSIMSERDVMAQVIDSMMESNSIRFVLDFKGMKDDGWRRESEFLYSREHGYLHRRYDDAGLLMVEVGDGEQNWNYRRAANEFVRKPGLAPERTLKKLLSPLADRAELKRAAALDDHSDGRNWQCYVFSDSMPEGQRRSRVWVDKARRLRRAETAFHIEGQWREVLRGNVEYDLRVKAADLQPDFGVTRIVDLGKLMEGMFPLDEAVYRQSFTYYEIAVHEVKRIGDHEYFLLLTCRPTPKANAKLKLHPEESPGNLHPSMRSEHHDDGPPFNTVEHVRWLMHGTGERVRVMAVLGYTDRRLPPSDVARPEFILFAHAQLWKEMKSISDVTLEVPLPKEKTPLKDVVRRAYDLTAVLEESPGFGAPSFQASLVDDLVDRTFIDEFRFGHSRQVTPRENPRPSEIEFDVYFQHIQDMPWRKDNRTVTVGQEE